jgi:hypothetical protein
MSFLHGAQMKHSKFLLLFFTVVLLAGCSVPANPLAGAATLVPTLDFQPTVPARTIFPTATLIPANTATPQMGETASPTPLSQVLATPVRAGTGTPTALTSFAPGIYVTAIRQIPIKPVSGGDFVTFYVSFANTTGKPVTFKWRVRIWTLDDSVHSFGDTTVLTTEIQPGVTELASASNWRTNPGPCTSFYARAYLINTDLSADPIEFKKPDGSPAPKTDFQVCPP